MKKIISTFSILVLFFAYVALSTGCSKSSSATSAACIDAPSGTITAAAAFTFTSSCSASGVTAYTWDFGDHTASVYTATAAHTYSAAGSYTITLTVVTSSGSSTTTKVVTVVSPTIQPQNFAGTFPVFDACLPTTNYNETVTTSGSTATIHNMGNHGTNVTGIISGANITIASQPFYTSGSTTWNVSGSGSLSANFKILNITFTADSANFSATCNVIGTKP
jgi:PKD repeat protein